MISNVAQHKSKNGVLAPYWDSALIEKTASGSVASFADGADGLPMVSVLADIEPIQDLNGYDNPWPAGGGINKLPNNATNGTQTVNGVTVTAKDGVYSFSGTATATANIMIPLSASVDLSPSTNKIAFLNNKVVSGFSVGFYRSGYGQIHYWGMSSVNRVVSGWTDSGNEVIDGIQISINSGVDTTGLVVSPMLMLLTESNPTTFTPYSNICPISGWDSVNVTRSGKNLAIKATESSNIYNGGNLIPVRTGETIYAYGEWTGSTSMWGGVWSSITATSKNEYISKYANFASGVVKEYTIDADGYFGIAYNSAVDTYTVTKMMISKSLITADDYEPYTAQTYTTTLPQTVYGGGLDMVSGVLTIDRALVDMGSLNWAYTSNYGGYFSVLLAQSKTYTTPTLTCSMYKYGGYNIASAQMENLPDKSVIKRFDNGLSQNATAVRVKDSSYSNAATFKTAMSGVQLVYELASPQTIQLSKTEVDSLLGDNVLWADSGAVSVVYRADSTLAYEQLTNAIVSLGGNI